MREWYCRKFLIAIHEYKSNNNKTLIKIVFEFVSNSSKE